MTREPAQILNNLLNSLKEAVSTGVQPDGDYPMMTTQMWLEQLICEAEGKEWPPQEPLQPRQTNPESVDLETLNQIRRFNSK